MRSNRKHLMVNIHNISALVALIDKKGKIGFGEKIHYLCTNETAVSEMNVSEILIKRQGYKIF